MRFAVRAPDHLGDAVMALPAVEALRQVGEVTVYTRGRWGAELYGSVRPGDELPDPASTGVLLKPSWHAAFRWRSLTRTVGVGPPGVYGLALAEAKEHRRERYARIVAAVGARVSGMPVYSARGVAPELPDAYVGINPWSPTRTVRWLGFARLAARLPGPVVAFAGPGEGDAVRVLMPGVRVIEGLKLPDFAAALARCSTFFSNDSGAAHFAAACGVPVVMVHGSTAPERTGVGISVERPDRLWCQPCYRKSCPFALGCLNLDVERVLASGVASGTTTGV